MPESPKRKVIPTQEEMVQILLAAGEYRPFFLALYSWRPCYEVREYRGTLCEGPCSRCAIYLNRNVKREKILEQYLPEP
jgi:hypothetical protein